MGYLTTHEEGTPICSFQSNAVVPIEHLCAYFSPQQAGSGTPSPENVREIQGWSNLNIYMGEKNLFENTTTISGYKNDNGVLTASQNSYHTAEIFDIDNNNIQSYVLKNEGNDALVFRIYFYDEQEQWISRSNQFVMTISPPAYFSFNSNGFLFPQNFSKIQFQFNVAVDFSKVKLIQAKTIPVTFPTTGKNLFDKTKAVTNERFNSSGIATAEGRTRSPYIPCSPNTTYYFKNIYASDIMSGIFWFDKNKNHISHEMIAGSTPISVTATSPNNAAYIGINFDNTYINSVAINYPSTFTDYEPYSSNNTIYGGYVDLTAGEVVQEWTEPLTLGEPYYYGGNVCFSYTYPSKYTRYPDNLPSNRVLSALNKSTFSINTKNTFIFGYDNTFETTDGNGNLNPEWTEWYNSLEIKPTVSLQLYEPIHYPLTPQTLSTLMGPNSIWSNASNKVTVDFQLHDSKVIMEAKRRMAANEPHLAVASGSVASFSTDMKAPLKSCKVNFLPVQVGSGDPSPENVREISGWTGCEVYKAGSNILTTLENNKYPLFLPTGTKLVASSLKRSNGAYNQIRYYRQDGTQIDYWTLNTARDNDRYSRTFTLLEDAYYFGSSDLDSTGNILDLKLEFNNYDTNGYTPPSGVKFTLDWTSSAGTVYGGYVDLIAGKVVNNWWSNTFTIGANEGTVQTNGLRRIAKNLQSAHLCDTSRDGFSVCPTLPYGRNLNTPYFSLGKSTVYFYLANDETAYTFTIYYPSTSITNQYSITVPQLKSLIGTNNLFSNTNSTIETTYWTH